MRRKLVAFFFFALAIFSAGPSGAQSDPREILKGMIHQVQTGTPNPLWYGQQLWATIAMQTNNSGYYPSLAQLGPVTNVTVHDQVQLPAGPLYAMVARHQNGPSSWVIGYSNLTKRIEYANFNLTGQPQVLPRPLPPPGPVGQPVPVPQPGQVAQPGTVPPPNPPANPSPACQRFPNLC